MRISIILPVYNIKDYLNRCIDSIILADSKIKGFVSDIILVDDGSTDGSADLCDEICKTHALINVIHKPNGGLSSAGNAAIPQAQGDYLFFVDSDDWIEENSLLELSKLIEKYHPDAVKFGYNRYVNNQVVESAVPGIKEGYYDTFNIDSGLYPYLIANGSLFDYENVFIVSAWANVYKKSIINDHNLRFTSERKVLNEDISFNLRYYYYVSDVYVIHQSFYNYDCRLGSLTQTYKKEMYPRKLNLLDEFEEFSRKYQILENDICMARYHQFVIQHMYDCLVMEALWNKDKEQSIESTRTILNDPRLIKAIAYFNGARISLKAKMILGVMRTRNPRLFLLLYKIRQ